MPLSNISNSIGVGCSEGNQREFPIWRTDRYGYNNDDTVFTHSNRILVVGDSYAEGACVHQEESVAGILRRSGYPANNVGAGGFGRLLELATIKEYGERQRPKAVVWLYFDGNDITDLERELHSAFLLQYLTDQFSQNLMDRQPEVDAFWKAGSWSAPFKEFQNSPQLKAEWERKLDENLPLVQARLGNDITSLRDDQNLIRVFGRIVRVAKQRIEGWGGKLYMVIIPHPDGYLHGSVSRSRFEVVNQVRELGLPVIDV